MQEVTEMALGTISDLIKKYKRFGYVKNHPRSGVKANMTPRIDQQIVKMAQENQFLSAPKASNFLEKECGIQVSLFTILNQLKGSGFKARVLRKKPFLSKAHQERKLAFAKKYVNMP